MKTESDLNALIPTLVGLIRNTDHEIGSSDYDFDDCGSCRSDDAIENYLCYMKDGWTIEINYKCCGEWESCPGDGITPACDELISAWGYVTEIIASHYDDDTGELSEFSDDDFKELRKALNDELKDIA